MAVERAPDHDPPNVARIYDYLLGGAHNFAVDRELGDELVARWPLAGVTARANRTFLRVAVEHFLDHGITQFLDLGSGIPTVGNVHEIAQRRVPDARVAYVDNEKMAVAHSRTLIESLPRVTVTDADLREPEAVLGAPGVAGLLDFDRPIGMLAVTALGFVPDDDVARDILGRYRRALAPGSMLALTHATGDYPVAARQYLWRTSVPVMVRSEERLRSLLGDLRVNADGVTDLRAFVREPTPVEGPLNVLALITEPL